MQGHLRSFAAWLSRASLMAVSDSKALLALPPVTLTQAIYIEICGIITLLLFIRRADNELWSFGNPPNVAHRAGDLLQI